MAAKRPKKKTQSTQNTEGITRITVAGFKSIHQEKSIEIRPLTILAGANSSGKSSMMQPLLLLKQTLEAPYDPGALLLNGPNVRFTSVDQLLYRTSNGYPVESFHVGIEVNIGSVVKVKTYFSRSKNKRIDVERTTYYFDEENFHLYNGMSPDEIQAVFGEMLTTGVNIEPGKLKSRVTLKRDRCFLSPVVEVDDRLIVPLPTLSSSVIEQSIRQVIHLPGWRGTPERNYPVTAVGSAFPGTFENYVASIIEQWQADQIDKLREVNRDLARLGLAGGVVAHTIDDTQVELLVTRYRNIPDGSEDMVSIADVGLGISQTLPVIVALHTADEGQLVYLEQPEIHLHPRAQSAMAEVLADAAMQGARLVVETHSSLLLLGIQTLVAEGKLPPEMVKLHWFKLLDDGSTEIISADLDETGAFGDWPEDFASVTLDSENRYLDAAQNRLKGK
ncbi:MAG: AAA family ATPase [Chloroflexi bacterium]|nr:AAA family ATPase [Chloroflexota bacterium]